MCKLKVADFYYGAFLSALLNTPGGHPSLFDESGSRRIYCLETNNNEECYFFAKYVTDIKRKSELFNHWVFTFTPTEIKKMQELHREKTNVKVVLICVKEGFADSELAIISYEDAMDCLGVEAGVRAYRINIKAYNKKHGLRMYGSGRSDKLDGKDNTLKVTRQELAAL
jgi:hypothetical protein